jgi:hypothetical protein
VRFAVDDAEGNLGFALASATFQAIISSPERWTAYRAKLKQTALWRVN